MKSLLRKIYPNLFLLSSLLFSVLLVIVRASVSHHLYFVFLIWNLFLAFLPFVFSEFLNEKNKNWSVFILLPLWLLFFPNAPYMITDLFHLKSRADMPYWFDLLLLFSFAWNGILLTYLLLLNVEKFLAFKIGKYPTIVTLFFIFLLCAFGIYLGRYLRWNSWDIISNPSLLAYDILHRLRYPLAHTRTYGVTFGYGMFLFFVYYSLKWLPKQISTHTNISSDNNVLN
jgi:uncharacterized membrane protein